MKVNLTSKFVMLVALSLLVTASAFAQNGKGQSKRTTGTSSTWQIYDICQNTARVALPVSPTEEVITKDLGRVSERLCKWQNKLLKRKESILCHLQQNYLTNY